MLYTIGYANKKINEFIDVLKQHNIEFIIDVRSSPFSKMFPEYNKNTLRDILNNHKIKYSHMPEYFGAQRTEDELYTSFLNFDLQKYNTVDFEKVYNSNPFQQGVNRLKEGLNNNHNICLLCSEKYPYDCHRNVMVASYFNNIHNFDVCNIVDKEITLSQKEVNEWCISNFNNKKQKFLSKIKVMCEVDIFGNSSYTIEEQKIIDFIDSNQSLLKKALKFRNLEIGYKKGDIENE